MLFNYDMVHTKKEKNEGRQAKKNDEKNLTTIHFFTISHSSGMHQHKTIIQCDYSI